MNLHADHNTSRALGVHVRLTTSLSEMIVYAKSLPIDFFQCFFVKSSDGTLIRPDERDIASFLQVRKEYTHPLFVHGSYWINLADRAQHHLRIIKREVVLARRLEFTHFVLHPGCARQGATKNEGIDLLARALNMVLKREKEIVFVLENTAHGGTTIGSDIYDFKLLLEKIDQPERIRFCVDTSHAYVFGYDMSTPVGQDYFLQLVDQIIGLSSVVLIHLNDAHDPCGSRIDKHALIGKGMIGEAMLHRFIDHPGVAHIPVLLELPPALRAQEEEAIALVRGWIS